MEKFLNTITSTAEIAWFHLLNAGRHGANEIAASLLVEIGIDTDLRAARFHLEEPGLLDMEG